MSDTPEVVTQNVPPTNNGRRYHPDPRDRGYPMEAPPFSLRLERLWRVGPTLNQGTTSKCVDYGWSQMLRSAPVMDHIGRNLPAPGSLYDRMQMVDEWPGPPPAYDGTSVRAGAKVLLALGLIVEYRWGRSIEIVKNYILSRGPVVVGTDWFPGMDEPRQVKNKKTGRIEFYLEATGQWRGGHCYMLSGYSRKRHAFRMVNSWGEWWAEKGRAWIHYDVMNYLLFQLNGEACSAVEPIPSVSRLDKAA